MNFKGFAKAFSGLSNRDTSSEGLYCLLHEFHKLPTDLFGKSGHIGGHITPVRVGNKIIDYNVNLDFNIDGESLDSFAGLIEYLEAYRKANKK